MSMRSKLLNPSLAAAVKEVLGKSKVSGKGRPGTYDIGDKKGYGKFAGLKDIQYAVVRDWGETVTADCPVCGDTKGRLHINYLCGQKVRKPGTKRTWLKFSDRLVKCFNEDCQRTRYDELKPYIDEILARASSMEGDEIEKILKKADSGSLLLTKNRHITLPVPYLPLTSDKVPSFVIEYLQNRKFDIEELSSRYGVVFCPKGATWNSNIPGTPEVEFYVPRIVIPFVVSAHLVYWQARRLDNEKKMKYRNPNIPGKAAFLYNFDNAMKHFDINLVEGPTDVWRIGDNTVAREGKTLAEEQLHRMSLAWSWCGSCVIVVDGDDDKALEGAVNDKRRLDENRAFPRGVGILTLDEGKDPADYSTEEIRERIEECRRKECTPRTEHAESNQG